MKIFSTTTDRPLKCVEILAAFVAILLGPSAASFGQATNLYKPKIGYDALVAEYGEELENGTGIRVFMAEGLVGGNYMPNGTHAEFVGKVITNGTSPPVAGASNHATNVGRMFFGNTVSIAPGISTITVASADDFVNRYTGYSTNSLPIAQGFHVSNHSYIADIANSSVKQSLLRRFDYIVNRDDTIIVVGANNGASHTAPDLWTHSFNAITVGRSDGLHSHGTTTTYGADREIPHLVVPMQDTGLNFTSYATPVVGASAAILKQAAGFDSAGHSLPGGRNQVIRAQLFAGATKEEFPDWDKTTSRPIDEVYGFGELNIYNSYKILKGGQYDAFKDPNWISDNIGDYGWDYGQFNGESIYYNFEIAPNALLSELSAALVWNVDVNPGTGSFPSHQLANLDLELFHSNGEFLGALTQASLSTVYNLEHIYLTDALEAGKYTFRISGNIPVDYGFAWRMDYAFTTAPEPSSLALLVVGCTVLLRRRQVAVS